MAKFTTGYTFGFAAGLCVVLSVAVASASMGLKPLQEANARRDLQSKILGAVGLPDDGSVLQGTAIDEMYAERIKLVVIDDKGEIVQDAGLLQVETERATAKTEGREPTLFPVYQRLDGSSPTKYVLELQGTGLWGPISGYIAIDGDGKTVSGVTFFAPKETPGLGYEITAPGFTDQWPGKTIFDGGHPVTVRVEKDCGAEPGPHCVDGVSGATLTSRGVDAMVAEAVEAYDPYLTRIRAGGM